MQNFAAHCDLVSRGGRQFTQGGIAVRIAHQGRQILGAGAVAAGQAGWLHIGGIPHPDGHRFLVHQADKTRQTAGIGASKRVGCTVFTGHQRQMQQLATAEFRADTQAGMAALFRVHIVLGNGDGLIQ